MKRLAAPIALLLATSGCMVAPSPTPPGLLEMTSISMWWEDDVLVLNVTAENTSDEEARGYNNPGMHFTIYVYDVPGYNSTRVLRNYGKTDSFQHWNLDAELYPKSTPLASRYPAGALASRWREQGQVVPLGNFFTLTVAPGDELNLEYAWLAWPSAEDRIYRLSFTILSRPPSEGPASPQQDNFYTSCFRTGEVPRIQTVREDSEWCPSTAEVNAANGPHDFDFTLESTNGAGLVERPFDHLNGTWGR